MAMGGNVETLDPHFTTNSLVICVTDQIYEPLLITDANMQLQPRLAHSWKQIDGRTWEFYLRKGITFHCGEPFTADAVKRTFERALDPKKPAPGGVSLSMVESVTVKDPYTVVIKTKEPFAPLLYNLAHSGSIVMCPRAIEQWGPGMSDHPCGTGQFRLASWTKGEKVVLTRNEKYYLEGQLDRVVFQTIPDEISRLIALETGAADIIIDLPPSEIPRIKSQPHLQVLTKPSLRSVYIALNSKKAPFDDERVRQALNYAVNREEIVTHVLEGLGTVANVPFAPGVWGSAQDTLKVYTFDQQKARSLLAEAGWKDTDGDGYLDRAGQRLKMTLNSPEGRYLRDREVAQTIQTQLRAIGIDAQLRIWEYAGYMAALKKRDLDMYLIGVGCSTADLDFALDATTYSKGLYNFHDYSNPRVDELFLAGRAEANTKKRLDMYYELQRILLKDAPVISLYHMSVVVALNRDRVEGFEPQPGERIRLLNTRLVKK